MSTENEPTVRLWHGTTRRRADAILKNGPDPYFREPGGLTLTEAFSAARPDLPATMGLPATYAEGKARLFPNEGGPAILEVEVPESICRLTNDMGGDVRFVFGHGLKELLKAWPSLTKRILEP
jgi:hypothetical protein